MGFDFAKEIKDSIMNAREGELVKWMAIWLAGRIGFVVIVAIMVAALLVGTIMNANVANDATGREFARAIIGSMGNNIGPIIGAFALFFVLTIIFALFTAFVGMKMTQRALVLSPYGKPTGEPKFADYVIGAIKVALVSLFTLRSMKMVYAWLGGYAFALLLCAAGAVTSTPALIAIGMVVAGLSFFAQMIMGTYHSLRFGLWRLHFLHRGKNIDQAMDASWSAMEGKAIEFFAINFVYAIIVGILALIVALPFSLLGMLIPLVDQLAMMIVAAYAMGVQAIFEVAVFRHFDISEKGGAKAEAAAKKDAKPEPSKKSQAKKSAKKR